MGAPAHARVRDYIVKQLALLGLQPQLQREFAAAPSFLPLQMQGVVAGMVENIVARVEGTADGPALLLVAHYDTVPNSPGASDDGHAVAALLETHGRCLLLRLPVTILFFSLPTEKKSVCWEQKLCGKTPLGQRCCRGVKL